MGNPLNVWCLEDEAQIRKLVRRGLEKRGHTVVEFERVHDVLAALEAIHREGTLDRLPDVFVSDVNLHDGTGDVAVRKAKELNVKRLILMSGRPDDNRLITERLGMSLLEKPFSLDVLVALVEGTT